MSETITDYLERVSNMDMADKPLTRARLEAEKACGDKEMKRRNYFVPNYQHEYLEILARANGMTMAAVLRTIIDDWVNSHLEV